MKIGVISDTHEQHVSEALTRLADGLFADVSIVLHAGDLTRIAVLDAFSGKTVAAVCGNMDHYDVTGHLPDKRIITIDGYRIGLIHGWGPPSAVEEKAMGAFSDVQAVVYGHTHEAANHLIDGVLLFNPGSFSGSRVRGGRTSAGIITIEKGKGISGEIIIFP